MKYQVLILAAGCSRRMKKFKPLLPLGKGCILQSVIDNFKKSGLEDILVVVGCQRQRVISLLKQEHVSWVVNEAYEDTDMLESVKVGLSAIKADTDAVFICPGDVPLIAPATIQEIIRTYEQGDSPILIPTYKGEMGHPPVYSAAVIQEIQNHREDGGLRSFLQRYPFWIRYLPVEDEEVVKDANLPEDYKRILNVYALKKQEVIQ
ncbi:nucleotidyltransferase family protein [Novisyntrophococcus fermenticellae]|uniref:nucleotidyltransferase family protein n=1 Tax=Novisyntrophococcus fermenticellae TaxID=2068655 RepID=UPI001E445970|nr:nucleotidyltransferase family protein [Novisyntrophococcus fermenticellae]